MISTVYLYLGVMASFVISVYPADLPNNCEQICDKYRKSESAFSLKCEDHQDDKDCTEHCQSCKDICTEDSPQKVYSCPGIERGFNKSDRNLNSNNESNSSVVGIVLWVVGILIVVVILIIIVVWYVKKRNKNGILMGGVGIRPAYPVLLQDDQSVDLEYSSTTQASSTPSVLHN